MSIIKVTSKGVLCITSSVLSKNSLKIRIEKAKIKNNASSARRLLSRFFRLIVGSLGPDGSGQIEEQSLVNDQGTVFGKVNNELL